MRVVVMLLKCMGVFYYQGLVARSLSIIQALCCNTLCFGLVPLFDSFKVNSMRKQTPAAFVLLFSLYALFYHR